MTIRTASRHWLTWLCLTIVVAGLLLLVRDDLEKTHVALAFLLLILAGSAMAGRRVGLALAAACFLLFDVLFIPPYNTLVIDNPLDWFVLAAFLVVGVVASELLHRAQREADARREHESLREANRLKNALLASVSHDLRTPLTTIKALAHELAAMDDRAMVIEEEADRLNRMVADLLDLTRVQSGTLVSSVEINPVDDLVGAALQRVSGAMPDRIVRVQLEEGGTLLVGRFDLAASLRILVNLIENANKYAPAGSPIDLMAVRRGAAIELIVADIGPGVPEAERERIFEPFYRRHDAAPDVGGAGLGLAISRGLAEAQNGTLRYSPRRGGGSEFTLSLPAADLPGDVIKS